MTNNKKKSKTKGTTIPPPPADDDLFTRLTEMIKAIDPKFTLKDYSPKFSLTKYKGHMEEIKNSDSIVLFARKNIANRSFFQNLDKDVGLFFKNRYIFFDHNTPSQDLRMPITRMLNGDNATNQCKVCLEEIKGASTASCTVCGEVTCLRCLGNLVPTVPITDPTRIAFPCPVCRSDKGIEMKGCLVPKSPART